MFKSILILGMALMLSTPCYALNLSRVKTWTNEVLTASDLNAEFDNILNHSISNADISPTASISGSKIDLTTASPIGSSSPSTGTFTTLSITGDTTIGNAAGDSLTINSNTITFEGATSDAFHDSLIITDPTANNSITIPNANSVTLPTGAAFYMMTGSCPPGTSDVSVTYLNKFLRINSTAGTSGGSDTHTHGAGSYTTPSHNHGGSTDGVTFGNSPSGSVGSDTAGGLDTKHYHGIPTQAAMAITGTSAAGDNVPSYVTAILCQVN